MVSRSLQPYTWIFVRTLDRPYGSCHVRVRCLKVFCSKLSRQAIKIDSMLRSLLDNPQKLEDVLCGTALKEGSVERLWEPARILQILRHRARGCARRLDV
jgi:hypothetical protein